MAPRRRYSVHPLNKKRTSCGEYFNYFPSLKKYPEKFHQYLRMDVDTFHYILSKVENGLMKNWTNFNTQPILPEERLVVTLR